MRAEFLWRTLLNVSKTMILKSMVSKIQIRQNICVYIRMLNVFFSDDFIQAQLQLARWASEDVVSVVMEQPGPDLSVGPSTMGMIPIPGDSTTTTSSMANGVVNRDYYPSPPSTETSSGSVIQPQARRGYIDVQQNDATLEITSSFPEYKH